MNRSDVLALWNDFIKKTKHLDNSYDEFITYNNQVFSDLLKEFLFDFVNFIEGKILDEHNILHGEDGERFLERMKLVDEGKIDPIPKEIQDEIIKNLKIMKEKKLNGNL